MRSWKEMFFVLLPAESLKEIFSFGHLFLTSTHATCRSVPTSLNVNVSKTVFMQFWEQTSLWPRWVWTLKLWDKHVCLCRFGQISNRNLTKEESFIETKLWHATKKSVNQSKLMNRYTVNDVVYCQRLKGSWWIHVFQKMLSNKNYDKNIPPF